MKKAYRYLTFDDRRKIEAAYSAGARAAEIAGQLGVSAAAIYRELERGATGATDENKRNGYSAVTAQRRLEENFHRRGRRKEVSV